MAGDGSDSADHLDGISSLIRLSGATVPARARFIGEAIVTSVYTSMTMGLCSGLIGATCLPIGPLIPFLFGSWTGYTLGLVQHWHLSKRSTMLYAQKYPTILAHALYVERGIIVPNHVIQASEQNITNSNDVNDDSIDTDTFDNDENNTKLSSSMSLSPNLLTTISKPTTVSSDDETMTLDRWIQHGGLGRLTWTILAAQSCRSDVEELQRQQREQLMENYKETYFNP